MLGLGRGVVWVLVCLGFSVLSCGADGGCGLNDFTTENPKDSPYGKVIQLTDIDDNFAGVSYFPANNTLVGVRNRPTSLFELGLDGTVLRRIDLKGFQNTQGIAHMFDSTFAVSEDTKRNIRIIDLMKTGDSISLKESKTISVNLPETNSKGLRGVAYDQARDVFYVVQEKSPVQVIKVFRNGSHVPIWNEKDQKQYVSVIAKLICGANQISQIVSFSKMNFSKTHEHGKIAEDLSKCLKEQAKKWTITDLVGIHFRRGEGGVPDKLWVLSKDGKAVFAMDTAGRVLERMTVGGDEPEGLVVLPGGTDMFIAGKPNQLLRYHCERGSEAVSSDGFHLLLEQMYNGYQNTTIGSAISVGMSWYRDLNDVEKFRKVQDYLNNVTVSSLLFDVNATLSSITGVQDPTSVAVMDVIALVAGLAILYCMILCIAKITFVGVRSVVSSAYNTTRWIGSIFIPSWRRGGKSRKGTAHTYEAMSDYHDVDLELGELEGLVPGGREADDLLADLEDFDRKAA